MFKHRELFRCLSTMHHKRLGIGLIAFGAALLSSTAFGAVNECEALTLYGNAYPGVCTELSKVNSHNGMMVCVLQTLPGGNVHITFSAGPKASNSPSPLHLTTDFTAPIACESHTLLGGGWPHPGLHIAAAGAQPNGWTAGPNGCGVVLANHVTALNNVVAAHNCAEAFTEAQANGLDPSIANGYIQMCKTLHCP